LWFVDKGPAMRRAFTIIELLVAMALLGALLAASGVIFGAAVKAHRTAEATAEISRKLAAITNQLNSDFMGLQKDPPFDCPFAIWFEIDGTLRHDQILFFADGDFQSYGYNSPSFVGNIARVYYGQANIMDVDYQNSIRNPGEPYEQADILARRQHIYSSDPCLGPFPTDPCNPFNLNINFIDNDRFEHDSLALSQWKVTTNDPCNNNEIIFTCFDNDAGRSGLDLDNAETLHMLMAQGVGHFEIQWSYFDGNELRWWPSDSDLPIEGMFGFYFNMPGGVNVDMDGDGDNDWNALPVFFPEALMFTFTLYDSKGIFEDGKTFTHIVYLD
jgi:prepilin-type N-terminal cleavage/methylation domain-containing protein